MSWGHDATTMDDIYLDTSCSATICANTFSKTLALFAPKILAKKGDFQVPFNWQGFPVERIVLLMYHGSKTQSDLPFQLWNVSHILRGILSHQGRPYSWQWNHQIIEGENST